MCDLESMAALKLLYDGVHVSCDAWLFFHLPQNLYVRSFDKDMLQAPKHLKHVSLARGPDTAQVHKHCRFAGEPM